MKPEASPARDRAVEALRKVLTRGAKATPLLAELGAGLSPADSDLMRELVLGVLRWRAALDDEIAGVCRVPIPRLAPKLREILEVGLYQLRHLDRIPQYAAVHQAVAQARASGGEGAARLVNGVLRGILLLPAPPSPREAGGGRREAEELARYFSHPEFLVARWLERFGSEETRRLLESDNRASPLDLMTNPRKTKREALRAALAAEAVLTEPSPLAPLALTVVSGNPLRSPLFSAGHFTIQDVASQALPLLLPAGEILVDLAAAPGGKSFAAIALGRARATAALDRSIARLRLVAANARRLGIAEAMPFAADVRSAPLSGGRFDRVLLDAPCSGTGTLRKSPEIRYRLTAEAIERLARAQEEALRAAAELLAPGGFLLYSTCSLEEEENERVVARTLEADAGLERAPIEAPPALAEFVAGDRFRILPSPIADGFTAHLLRRAWR